MHLTRDEVIEIAAWGSTREGFGRDEPLTRTRIQAIADRINSLGDLGCERLTDDGISNYFVLFAYVVAEVPSFALAHRVDGLLIYLSACAPVGVLGRSQKCVGP